ncbi:hypothetical protein BOVA115_2999 [Bacteroides ovatus]|nr:hypothetical protein BOVA115_2999 [Bacteroides ovatus]
MLKTKDELLFFISEEGKGVEKRYYFLSLLRRDRTRRCYNRC